MPWQLLFCGALALSPTFAWAQSSLPDLGFKPQAHDPLHTRILPQEEAHPGYFRGDRQLAFRAGRNRHYSTIQSAIDAAHSGGLILVDQGIYTENLDFQGKDLRIIAVDGPEKTTLDGRTCTRGEAACATISVIGGGGWIEGFTIIGGSGERVPSLNRRLYDPRASHRDKKAPIIPKIGGGLFMQAGQLTVANSIFTGGLATHGGGIGALAPIPAEILEWQDALRGARRGSSPTYHMPTPAQATQLDLIECQVVDNMAYFSGGGIYANGIVLTASGGRISGNEANHGGGLAATRGEIHFTEVELLKDRAQFQGGALYLNNGSAFTGLEVALVEGWAQDGALLFAEKSEAHFESAWMAFPRGNTALHAQRAADITLMDITIWSDGVDLYGGESLAFHDGGEVKIEDPNFVDLQARRSWHLDDLGAWRNGDPSAHPTLQIFDPLARETEDLTESEIFFDAIVEDDDEALWMDEALSE